MQNDRGATMTTLIKRTFSSIWINKGDTPTEKTHSRNTFDRPVVRRVFNGVRQVRDRQAKVSMAQRFREEGRTVGPTAAPISTTTDIENARDPDPTSPRVGLRWHCANSSATLRYPPTTVYCIPVPNIGNHPSDEA